MSALARAQRVETEWPEGAHAAGALAAPRAGIESAFLGIGEKLGRCVGVLGRLSSVFEALPADFQSRELDEAGARLEALGLQACGMTASFADERRVMAALITALNAAASPIEDLLRSVKTIGIVAINARVVAAGLAAGHSGLEVFTTDIAALSEEANAAVGRLSAVYRGLVEEVRRAETRRAAFEATHTGTLLGLGGRIAAPLARVTERRREAAKDSARTGEATRRITGRVAQAVSALQIGDNTRQRVEHAETALSVIGGATEVPFSPAPALRARLIDAVCRLQAAQVEATVEAFLQEAGAAEGALRELAMDVKDMVSQSVRMVGNAAGSGEAPLAALNNELRFVAEMLRSCEAERKRLDAMGAEVGGLVRSLLDHVKALQNIEAEMRLLSLNATVKCAQLGSHGRALNVIAQQLRELTAETVGSAEAAASSLGKAAETAHGLVNAAESDATSRLSSLEDGASRAVGLLEGVDRRLNAAVAILTEAAPKVTEMLHEAADALAGQRRVADALTEARRRIASLCPPDRHSDLGTLAAEEQEEATALFAQLRRLYTMEGERSLHDSIVAGFGLAARPATESSGGDVRPEADFELF